MELIIMIMILVVIMIMMIILLSLVSIMLVVILILMCAVPSHFTHGFVAIGLVGSVTVWISGGTDVIKVV